MSSQRRTFTSSILYSRVPFLRCRLFILASLLLILLIILYTSPRHKPGTTFPRIQNPGTLLSTRLSPPAPNTSQPKTKILKATSLYGRENPLLEAALKTHIEHNTLHDYDMRIQRTRLAPNFSGKLSWLSHVLTTELLKPQPQRVEWIMYFDASLILLNPQIPLSIFIPPPEVAFSGILFVLTKPQRDTACASTIFIRASSLSLSVISKAATAPYQEGDDDTDMATSSLMKVLELEDSQVAVYQPSTWYNTHFSGDGVSIGGFVACTTRNLRGGARWKALSDLLRLTTALDGGESSASLEQTAFASETREFWNRVREAKELLRRAQERLDGEGYVKAAVEALRDRLALYAYDGEALLQAIEKLEEALASG